MIDPLRYVAAAALLMAMMLSGCADAEPETEPGEGQTMDSEVTFAPELGVDLDQMQQTPSGLRYQILEEGTGQTATAGSEVAVHYTGWLPSGESFDSSVERGQPFVFGLGLGQGQVIQGWDEGVQGMKIGERRRLVIPPALAYGSRGAGGVIPADATLVFDVELLEVR